MINGPTLEGANILKFRILFNELLALSSSLIILEKSDGGSTEIFDLRCLMKYSKYHKKIKHDEIVKVELLILFFFLVSLSLLLTAVIFNSQY